MRKLIVFGCVLAAAGGAFQWYRVRAATPEPTVTTQPLTRGDIVDAVGATGTLEAVETVDVGTQVSGVVDALYADFNTIVKKGQVIAKLDPQLMQTQIEQQQANVTRAEADLERLRIGLADAWQKLERARQLVERSLIPRTELETTEVNVKSAEAQIRSSEALLAQARAQLNNWRVNLNYTTITAPIDGIVISRNVDQGQTVAASMNAPTLFVIAADLSRMQVIANIDEADVGRMRPGQTVTFRVDAFPTDRFTGTVSQVRLQPAVVQNVVTYSTVISVPNPELKLKPGMTAQVNIEIARRNNVLRVPTSATRFRPTSEMFTALNQSAPPEPERGRGGPGGNRQGGRGGGAPQTDGVVRAAAASLPASRSVSQGVTTIDSLFAPLQTRETRASAWHYDTKQLKMVRLRLGVSDGTFAEVLNEDDLPGGAELVVSMTTGRESRTAAPSAQTNPLMGPQRGGPPGGPGGFGGGAGGRGGR